MYGGVRGAVKKWLEKATWLGDSGDIVLHHLSLLLPHGVGPLGAVIIQKMAGNATWPGVDKGKTVDTNNLLKESLSVEQMVIRVKTQKGWKRKDFV